MRTRGLTFWSWRWLTSSQSAWNPNQTTRHWKRQWVFSGTCLVPLFLAQLIFLSPDGGTTGFSAVATAITLWSLIISFNEMSRYNSFCCLLPYMHTCGNFMNCFFFLCDSGSIRKDILHRRTHKWKVQWICTWRIPCGYGHKQVFVGRDEAEFVVTTFTRLHRVSNTNRPAL